ncbi:hypothetical protein HID58_060190 [Brassica napus]|uniref:Replication factor A C-terminal domain-containing protein n=1 Tax=Brassica napus TaxID=3708 RepID=A0ABQ7ZV27_BRANA|nr:hypothetical protein HID58_060190 [Brassica napus]
MLIGTVIQGFISPGRIEKYLPDMKRGSVYKLNIFYGSRNKSVFRVADHTATVSFSWNSELSVLQDCPTHFDEDRFRGPVMKLYLWDQAAREFCKKFKTYENTPTVLLVTTVNTKTLGGSDFYLYSCLDLNVLFACIYGLRCPTYHRLLPLVNAEVVTKRETMTIGEIFAYINQGSTKVLTLSVQISVYDNSEQAVLVLLGDAGRELTGKSASELVRSYFEENGSKGVNHEAPVPEALISTIRQRHKFRVKVTEHNFLGKARSLTVTKILPLDTPPATGSSEGNQTTATSEETSGNRVDSAEGNKRTCASTELEKTKRPKCGN